MKLNVVPRIISLTFLLATLRSTAFSDTSWNVPAGDWTVGGNWTGGVPQSGTPATIDNSGTATLSGTTGISDILKVGLNQSGNGLIITNSGSLAGISSSIGDQSTSSSNSVLVTGTGSTWNNTGLLFIGGDGSNNTLTISNGGAQITGGATLGNGSISSGNSVLLTGNGSTWTMTDLLFVGGAGGSNTLTVSAGATLSTGGFELGDQSTSSNNTAVITGTGTTWSFGSGGYVGLGGTSNILTVSAGAVMNAQGNSFAIGWNSGANNNSAVITGAGSSLTDVSVLTIGQSGTGNNLSITNGGTVTDARGVISGTTGATGNSVLVTGTGSLWNNTTLVFVGFGDSGNSLTISSGGLVTTGTQGPDSSFIGYNLTSNNNTTTVNSGTWTNAGQLTIGNFGSSNNLVITNGGVVSDTNGLVAFRANSGSNIISVTGTGSQWNNSGFLYVGRQGNDNSLTIANGGSVTVSGTDPAGVSGIGSAIGFKGTASNNSVLVTTGGSWNNTFGIAIGALTTGTNNSLTVSDGGTVSASFIVIAATAGSSSSLNIGTGGASGTINTGTIIGGAGTAVVNFNHSDAITFATPLAGSLSVNQLGTGTTILTANNTYSGTTTINAGLLQVDGTIASPATIVNAPGTLGGSGTVGGNVLNGGFVSPGGSPGTLTIGGNYTQTSAGTLVIQVAGLAAGQHDLLAVGGSAALNGTLQFVRLNNFTAQAGSMVIILTAGSGVTGRFSGVTGSTGTILGINVVYQPNDVLLEFIQNPFAGLPGLTSNQSSVARNLDGVGSDPRTAALIAFLDSEPLGNLPHDYDLLAAEELTSIFGISFSFADVQASNIENHLDGIHAENTPSANVGVSARPDETTAGYSKDDDKKAFSTPAAEIRHWNLFMEGNGEFVHVNGDTNAAGYNFTTGGVTVGADYRVCDHFTVGIMGGYADTGATLTQGGAVDVNSGRLGIYSTTYGSGFYLNTLAAGGYNSYDTHRTGLGGIAQGNTDGEEFDGLISTGYDLHAGNVTLGPIASVQYTYVGINSFTEAGSLAPLNIPSQSQESFRSKVGFKISTLCHVSSIVVTPTVSAAWQHEYLDSTYALDSSFASGAGNVFTVTGPALGRDSVVVNAGVNVQWTPRLGSYLYYDGELGRKNYQLNSVSGGVRVSF